MSLYQGALAGDACTLADAYARGETDPVEVFERALDAARHRPEVFIDCFPERGYREAVAARARWRAGQPLSALDGVPVAWKDMFDVAGSVTTAASATRRQAAPAKRDAVLVQRLAQAGLVSIGKTNLSEFAYSGLGLNPHFGTPVLARAGMDARAPGGSSSGSAIAVAEGIVPLALGTDTAGSIRVPAAFNGLVGLRASRQRYDLQGICPLSESLDTAGPLARSVRDMAAVDGLLRGMADAPVVAPAALRGLRLVVDDEVIEASCVTPAVRDNTRACLMHLAQAGVSLETRRLPAWHESWRLLDELGWLGAAEAYVLHEALLDSPDAALLDPRVRLRLEQARVQPASHVVRLYRAWRDLRTEVARQLDGAFLVTPTVAHVAPPLAPLEQDAGLFARTNLMTLRLTMPGSFLDMPGISLPSGVDGDGLPTGLLLSAPGGSDDGLLRAALAVESVLQRQA